MEETLEDLPLEIRTTMWFMHDGTPYSSLVAHDFFNRNKRKSLD